MRFHLLKKLKVSDEHVLQRLREEALREWCQQLSVARSVRPNHVKALREGSMEMFLPFGASAVKHTVRASALDYDRQPPGISSSGNSCPCSRLLQHLNAI